MTSNSITTTAAERARILKAAAACGLYGSGLRQAPLIMAALCNPATSTAQVGALLVEEPVLCARVLQVANSAYYGQSRSVTSIERALAILGLDAVRGIAAVVCLNRTLSQRREGTLMDMSALLNHSYATAIAADALARLQHAPLSSVAFIGGLLHNLGVNVQIQLDAAGVERLIRQRGNGDRRDIRELEVECGVPTHADCVAVVFEEWGLPALMVGALRAHHEPLSAPQAQRDLAALIHLGATLALESGHTFALEPAAVSRDPRAIDSLGLSTEQIDSVVAALPERLAEFRKALLEA
jgi:HD-like signal output (HDOD) protein